MKNKAQEELGYLGRVTVVRWEIEDVMNFTANTVNGDLPWRQVTIKLTYTVE